MKSRGQFITFEGTEGVGKSTQLTNAASTLDQMGLDYIVTREPGGTPMAEAIRELLLAPRDEPVNEITELPSGSCATVLPMRPLPIRVVVGAFPKNESPCLKPLFRVTFVRTTLSFWMPPWTQAWPELASGVNWIALNRKIWIFSSESGMPILPGRRHSPPGIT